MISFTPIDFEIKGREIYYTYQVQAGAHQKWPITKTYDEFESFHHALGKQYGKDQLPYLTGRVAPWNVGTRETGARRLGRLEEYLNQVTSASEHFEPP